MNASAIIGDRSSSDVVVRLRTEEGRDDWIYCHSSILKSESTYFAECLSENWPASQILDNRACVEVHCQESEFNHHVTLLRLLYIDSSSNVFHGVRHALGILPVAVSLGCHRMLTACVDYLSAAPWDESEEEEILRIVPTMGSVADTILARLQPVSPKAVESVFLCAINIVASSYSPLEVKSSVKDQVEYIISEDDDAPLLTADQSIKLKVLHCSSQLLERLQNFLQSIEHELELDDHKIESFHSHLSDLSWVFRVLSRLNIVDDFVGRWLGFSENMVRVLHMVSGEQAVLLSSEVVKVGAGVLDIVGSGRVVLPTCKWAYVVKVWLPFIRIVRPVLDETVSCDIWQTLESSFVSILLTLPDGDVTEFLNEWLENGRIDYPDLREVFEIWCYRSNVALRRLWN